MIILVFIFLIILGIIIWKISDYNGSTLLALIGDSLIVIFIITVILCGIFIIVKPYTEKDFDIKYNTYKNIINDSNFNDIRDTNITLTIASINSEIMINRTYKDDFWIGIFYSDIISNYELLNKED